MVASGVGFGGPPCLSYSTGNGPVCAANADQECDVWRDGFSDQLAAAPTCLFFFGMPGDLGIVVDRHRTADQEALDFVAGFLGEEGKLLLGFHAFGHHRQIEAARKPDHRADDGRGLRALFQVADERPVDLDLVERKRLQIGQRRIAGAEIVHRDAHAKRLEPAQDRHGAGEVADQHALGDLKLEPRGSEAGFQQHGMNERGQVAMAELHRRQVDRDAQRLGPGRGLPACLAHDPFAHGNDEAAFLGQRNEGARAGSFRAADAAIVPEPRSP